MPTTVLSQSLVALLVAGGCGDDQLGGAINPHNARALIEQLELVPPAMDAATELDGELRYHYGAVGWFGKGGTQTGVVVDLRAIMLDATGCPVAGSLRASLSYLAPMLDAGSPPPGEPPPQASFAVHGTVAFGPRCGEASY